MNERDRMDMFIRQSNDRRSRMNDARYWMRKKPNSYQPTAHIEEASKMVREAREANRQAVRLWFRKDEA